MTLSNSASDAVMLSGSASSFGMIFGMAIGLLDGGRGCLSMFATALCTAIRYFAPPYQRRYDQLIEDHQQLAIANECVRESRDDNGLAQSV